MNPAKEPLFKLRVLAEYDAAYGVYVARCLETGHVVTADSLETAWEMMNELLRDELSYAVEHQNFPNLFSSPASFDVFARWMEFARKKDPKTHVLNIDASHLRFDDEKEVPAEIRYATT